MRLLRTCHGIVAEYHEIVKDVPRDWRGCVVGVARTCHGIVKDVS